MTPEPNKLEEELSNLKESVQRPNILLAGGTGVGKSSLVNHIFGQNIARSGTGKPITQTIDKYEDKDSKVVIFDSKGYEIGSEQEKSFINDVLGFCQKETDPKHTIHIAWYLIQSSGSRITDFDLDAIKRIKDLKTPVAVVFTKSDTVNEEDTRALRKIISDSLPGIPCFEVTTKDNLPEPAASELQQQLADLISWTERHLPEALRLAFISQQKIDLEKKRRDARNFVYQHATGAALTGLTPIPGSDAPLLLANQYALLARVLYLFGLDGDKDRYALIIKSAMAQLLPTIGKWGAAQLIKMVPGIGTLIGGAINAAVASSLTMAFGFAIVETVYFSKTADLEKLSGTSDDVSQAIEDTFTKFLKENMEKAQA